MELKKAMHIARNPFGWNEYDIGEARLAVCDEVERLQRELLICGANGFREGMKRAASIAYGACNGLIDTPGKEPYVATVYEAICAELA